MNWKITERPVRTDNPEILIDAFWKNWSDLELRFIAYACDNSLDNPYRKYDTLRVRRRHIIKDLDGWDFLQYPPVFKMTGGGVLPEKSESQWRLIIKENDKRIYEGSRHYPQGPSDLLLRMTNAYKKTLEHFTKVLSGEEKIESAEEQKALERRMKLADKWANYMNGLAAIPKLAAELPEQYKEDDKSEWRPERPSEEEGEIEDFNDIDS